jgi:hypothetical protein
MTDLYGQGSLVSSSATTLAQLKTICKYRGWRDNSDDGNTALVRFINDIIYQLSTLAPWPEYLKRDGSAAITSATDEYTLDETGIDRIGIIERASSTISLEEIPTEEWLSRKRTLSSTGTPTHYAVEKTLTGGVTVLKLLLYPFPTESETLYYSYYRKPVPMVSDSDIADWPDTRIWLITNAVDYIMANKDTSGFSLHSPEFMKEVNNAMIDARGSYKPIKCKRSFDNRNIRIRDTYWNFS